MNLINLLTDVAVVADATRFISRKFKGNIESSGNSDDDKESNEHDYDEDEDQIEESKRSKLRK
jgi:hypothetical protein